MNDSLRMERRGVTSLSSVGDKRGEKVQRDDCQRKAHAIGKAGVLVTEDQ
jgi:hypothetical protein